MLGLFTEYRWAGIAIVVLSLLTFAGYERIQEVNADERTSTCLVGRANDAKATVDAKLVAAAVAASAVASANSQTITWRDRATTAEENYADLQTKHAVTLAYERAALADAGRLRNSIAAYAAGPAGSGLAPDTAAAASRRAGILGGLLAEALRADAESANDAESNGDAVRSLLAAWPSSAAASAAQ